MDNDLRIRRIHAGQVQAYRELRLTALQLHPEAFASSFEEEAALPEGAFVKILTTGAIFGAWSGDILVGCAGLARREKVKLQHKAVLWGMFVSPAARGSGIGKRLLNEVLDHARTCCEEVLLTVIEDNNTAIRLYTRAGFERYGREPQTLKIGSDYHSELLMRLSLREGE